MKTTMGAFSPLTIVLGAFVASMMTPASADAPTVFSVTLPDLHFFDPCTGVPDTAHFSAIEFVHLDHPNDIVVHAHRSGFTDGGYKMFEGNEAYQNNGQEATLALNDLWRRDSDGSMFHTHFVYNIDDSTGAVKQEQFRLECIGDDASYL